MRDEERLSAIQVKNVSEDDFVLRPGEFIGETEQVTAADNEEAALRPSGGEEVFSEAAATLTGGGQSRNLTLRAGVMMNTCRW